MPTGGAATRCPGWCDPIEPDLLLFGLAVAGAVVGVFLVYLLARRVLRSWRGAAGLSAAMAVGVAIALTAGLTAGGLDIVQRHSRLDVAFGPHGLTPVDPVFLGGDYVVRWSAASGPALCHLQAHLLETSDPSYVDVLANAAIGAGSNLGGTDAFLSVPRGEYYVDAVTDCATWTITLTPTT